MAFLLSSVGGKKVRHVLELEQLGDMTVAEVRQKAAELTDIPKDKVRLIYCGKMLADGEGNKLAECGVKKGSNVHILRCG